jgi:hypothetical protein
MLNRTELIPPSTNAGPNNCLYYCKYFSCVCTERWLESLLDFWGLFVSGQAFAGETASMKPLKAEAGPGETNNLAHLGSRTRTAACQPFKLTFLSM